MRSRNYITLLIFFIFCKNISGQSHLYLDAAQIFSTFQFSSDNLQNNTVPGPGYSTISSTAFGIGYEYVNSSGLLVSTGLGVRKAGSSLVYNKINYAWSLQYIDLRAGIGYQYNKWRIRPYISVSPFYATLLSARQTIGLNYYDIKASNTIKSNDFGLFITAGFNVPISRLISIYIDYNYILGLRNIETTESQYLYNRGSAFKLGLLFNISATKTKDTLFVKSDPILQSAKTINSDSIKIIKDDQTIVAKKDLTKTIILDKDKLTTLPKDTLTERSIENNKNSTMVTNENPEKLNEKQLQDISKIALNKNITFKIQIAAVKKELNANHSLLKSVTGPIQKENSEDGFIRYYSGSFKTYEKARAELDRIKLHGTTQDAFIVAFKDGKKITILDAKKLLK